MIRTQVYLPVQLSQVLSMLAKQEKKPKAQIIREALEVGIAKKSKKRSVGEVLLELAKIGQKYHLEGPTDLSTNHDKYLYEDYE